MWECFCLWVLLRSQYQAAGKRAMMTWYQACLCPPFTPSLCASASCLSPHSPRDIIKHQHSSHQPGQTGSDPPDFVHIIPDMFNTFCTRSSECLDSLCVSVTSSMSGWPCHNDAASVCPFVFHPGAERRAPSGGGSGTCSAGLEKAEKKRTGQK